MLHTYLVAVSISALIILMYALEARVYVKKHYRRIKEKDIIFSERLLGSIKIILYTAMIFPSALLLIQMLFLRESMIEAMEESFNKDEHLERI